MADTIDPVGSPQAYQRLLLGLLGDDDPADVQADTPAALRRLLAEAGPDLRVRPERDEWSVLECVGHIWDAELVSSGRYRWIVSHDEPDIVGYDQDRWVERLRWADPDVDLETEVLRPFEALRAADVALWRRLPPVERARLGHHRERGPESYELTFRMLAGHDRFHLAQARRTLEAVRPATKSSSSTELRSSP